MNASRPTRRHRGWSRTPMATDRMPTTIHTVGGIRIEEEILTVVAGIPTTEAPEMATLEAITTATDLLTLQHQPHQHRLAQPCRRPIIPLNTPNTMPVSLVEILMRHTEAMQTILPTTNT